MAEGNQSDLVVSISVDTAQVRAGFEEVVRISKEYAQKVASIWTKDFASMLNPTSIRSAAAKASQGVKAAAKPIAESMSSAIAKATRVINPGPGKVASEGEMSKVEKKWAEATKARVAAMLEVRGVEAQIKKQKQEQALLDAQARADQRYANEQRLMGMRAQTREAERLKKIDERRLERQEKYAEQDARANARKRNQEMLQAYAKAVIVLRYLLRAIRAIVRASQEWIDTANEIYQSQVKLAAALRVHNDLSDGQVRYLYQQVDALSKINGLSRDVNYSAAQILASYVGAADGLVDMVQAVDALVLKTKGYSATAQDAVTMARIVGRALSGNLQTLKRYGIELTTAEQAIVKSGTATRAEKVQVLIGAISRYTGDLSNLVNTWAGQTNLTKVNVEGIKNELGLALQNFLLPIVKCVNVILSGVSEISKYVHYISVIAFGNNIKGAEEMASAAGDAEDAYESLEKRLLGFDKFNVLSGGGEADGLLSGIGDASGIPELESALPKWVEDLSKIEPVVAALKVALIAIAASLGAIVAHVALLGIKGLIATIKGMVTSVGLLNTGLGITKAQLFAVAAGVALLVAGIYEIVQGIMALGDWENMTGAERAQAVLKVFLGTLMSIAGVLALVHAGLLKGVVAMLAHAKAAIVAALSNAKLATSLATLAMWAAAISVAAGGIFLFVSNMEKLSSVETVAWGVAAALLAVAAGVIAVKVAHAGFAAAVQAALIAGGLTLALGALTANSKTFTAGSNGSKIPTLADGGIPNKGQLFIANEAGPELVGNIGGKTSVANNAMITQAIEEAAYRGFSRANQGEGGGVTLTIQGDAVRNDALVRALMPAFKTEIKRQGGLKKAFGGE